MFLGHYADNFIGNPRAFAQASEVELLHFSAAAHIVHQVISIPFAADESHDQTFPVRRPRWRLHRCQSS
jgi:hypothetical protein